MRSGFLGKFADKLDLSTVNRPRFLFDSTVIKRSRTHPTSANPYLQGNPCPGPTNLAAYSTAHLLEYADWWNPILTEPLRVEKGMAIVRDATGTGGMG